MPYKILSLDGGGTWALIQARALEELYPGKRGHKILEEFDLVAANSGGSVILAGLAANMTPKEIGNIFDDAAGRRKIFHDKGMLTPLLRRFWWLKLFSRYVAEEKPRGLEKSYSDAAQKYRKEGVKDISNAWIQNINSEVGGQPDLLITAFDYHSRRARLFRSSMSSEADVDRKPNERCRLIEVVHASSNAPISFFDKPAVVRFFETVEVDGKTEPACFSTDLEAKKPESKYWDGAIAAMNNPVLVAVTEALANGEKPENIVVLSIGNGTVRREPELEGKEKQHGYSDLLKVATTILDDPPDSATYIAHVALTNGAKDRMPVVRMQPVVRMNPVIARSCFPAVSDKGKFEHLSRMEIDAVEEADVDAIKDLAERWINNRKKLGEGDVLNQPIRPYSPFVKEKLKRFTIGYPTFLEAKTQWDKLSKPALNVARM
jgi:predicted acylesterase/phospholipase RssA